jgi:hypothetical protein
MGHCVAAGRPLLCLRNARPGRASVIVLRSSTSSPLTITESIPVGAAEGFAGVP